MNAISLIFVLIFTCLQLSSGFPLLSCFYLPVDTQPFLFHILIYIHTFLSTDLALSSKFDIWYFLIAQFKIFLLSSLTRALLGT